MIVDMLIETRTGQWVELDTFGEAPAMVIQSIDWGTISDRKASYSHEVRLPKTAHNCRVLEFVEDFTAQSRIPYSYCPVEVYVDGVSIIPSGYKLVITKVSDVIHANIISGIKTVFETLSQTPFSELALPPFVWDLADMESASSRTNGHKYLQGSPWIRGSKPGFFNAFPAPFSPVYNAGTILTVAGAAPYFPMHETFAKIFEQQGYSVDFGGLDLSGPQSEDTWYYPLTKSRVKPDTFGNLEGSVSGPTYDGQQTLPYALTQAANSAPFNYGEMQNAEYVVPDADDVVVFPTRYAFVYTALGCYNMSINFQFICNWTMNGNRVYARVTRGRGYSTDNPKPEYKTIWATEDEGQVISENTTLSTDVFEVSPGEEIFCEAYILEGTLPMRAVVSTSFPHTENTPGPGSKIYPAETEQFKTQLEFATLFLLTFGLTINLDEDNKVVHLRNLKDIISYIPIAPDWTAKIDMSSTNVVSFKYGSYGQKNTIKLLQNIRMAPKWSYIENNQIMSNSLPVPFVDTWSFDVFDANLPESKDIITLPFHSLVTGEEMPQDSARRRTICNEHYICEDGRFQFSYFAPTQHYPLFKLSDSQFHIVQPHSEPYSATYRYTPYGPALSQSVSVYLAKGYAPSDTALVAGDIGEKYYSVFADSILRPARKVEVMCHLTVWDIANFDPFLPIYLEQYGDYFLVEKIDNFQPGKLTKVTFVCLNIARRETTKSIAIAGIAVREVSDSPPKNITIRGSVFKDVGETRSIVFRGFIYREAAPRVTKQVIFHGYAYI